MQIDPMYLVIAAMALFLILDKVSKHFHSKMVLREKLRHQEENTPSIQLLRRIQLLIKSNQRIKDQRDNLLDEIHALRIRHQALKDKDRNIRLEKFKLKQIINKHVNKD